MNCSDFDILHTELIRHISDTSRIFWIVSLCFVSIFSFLMIAVGEKIIKPSSGFVCGVVGFLLGYTITSYISETECETKIFISAIFGVVLSFVGFCIMKAGIFIVGATAFGTVGHYIFNVVPDDILPTSFVFLNLNGAYWITIACSGILGAIMSKCFKKDFLILVTSMLGGSGIAFSTYVSFEKLPKNPIVLPDIVYLFETLFFLVIGIFLQRRRFRKKNNTRPPSNV